MQKFNQWMTRMVATASVFLTANWAQVGPPARQTQPATANSLPLSGRTAQSGSVTATESPVPGTTNSVNTINPTVQVQGPYAGSIGGKVFAGKLSLHEAVERALQYNLGSVGVSNAVRQSRGQSNVARSALLPNLNGTLSETVEQLNLVAIQHSAHCGFLDSQDCGPLQFFRSASHAIAVGCRSDGVEQLPLGKGGPSLERILGEGCAGSRGLSDRRRLSSSTRGGRQGAIRARATGYGKGAI
jgi:hypothetical protein